MGDGQVYAHEDMQGKGSGSGRNIAGVTDREERLGG